MELRDDIIKEILLLNSQDITEEYIKEKKERIQPLYQDLKIAYNNLKSEKVIQEAIFRTDQKKKSIRQLLNFNETINYENAKKNANQNNIKRDLLKLYDLAPKILTELNLIPSIHTTVTYVDGLGGYYRAGDFEIKPEHIRLHDGGLYLIESSIKKYFAQQQKSPDEKKIQEKIQSHFQAFSRPYYRYAKSNRTGWTINNGIVAEAFERHWEELSHSIDKVDQLKNSDVGSVGHRWVLYKKSSGSAAFYTGPDTGLAQVKNYNASLIHDLNTILNAVSIVFSLLNDTSQNRAQNIQNIQKALEQSDTNTFSQKIWDGISDTAKKVIQKELKGVKIT